MKTADQYSNEIINKLDDYARDFDQYEYGLPTHDEAEIPKMQGIIKPILQKYAEQMSVGFAEWVIDQGWEQSAKYGFWSHGDIEISTADLFQTYHLFLTTQTANDGKY